jgi:dTDP-4-amino-4,6-dideoxygalactose transaminase
MSISTFSTSNRIGELATQSVPVPMADLRAQFALVGEQVMESVRQTLESSAYILGPRVAEFETDFAQYAGAKHCVAVNSGTSALHLALICAGVKPGDEVITVPMTFVATCWAISYCGATPVFVDIDPITYTMDAGEVEQKITPRTKAILPVHLYGQSCDMRPLADLCAKHGIALVEDCAQAHGAIHHGRPVGTIGQSGCFSFYPGKNLGACGEAGAVITNDDAIAHRCKSLRDHAQAQRYHHSEIGFNYRMDGLQGAVLSIKLKYLERWTHARAALADRYLAQLADLPITLPKTAKGNRHVWHLFMTLHKDRDEIRRALEARQIQTGLHYPIPLHLQAAYAHLGHKAGDFPVAERVGRECLTLPLFAEMTIPQQDAVIGALRDALA